MIRFDGAFERFGEDRLEIDAAFGDAAIGPRDQLCCFAEPADDSRRSRTFFAQLTRQSLRWRFARLRATAGQEAEAAELHHRDAILFVADDGVTPRARMVRFVGLAKAKFAMLAHRRQRKKGPTGPRPGLVGLHAHQRLFRPAKRSELAAEDAAG